MRIQLAALLLTSLSACAVGPQYSRPTITLAPTYVTPAHMVAPEPEWWRRFDDPLLDRIVMRVLAQNLDVAAAGARIAQARAAAGLAGAALLPTGGAGAAIETASQSLRSPFGAAAHELGFPRGYDLYQLGSQASWEIDLFGGLGRQRQAARADAAGAEADAAAVRLSVVAETADSYIQLRELQARVAVADKQLEVARALVGLIRQRVDQGVSAERDLQRALGEEEGVTAALPPLRAALAGQMNRLDVLMGTQAGTARAELASAGAIPLGPDPSGSAHPAELMRRRPDVVAAERRLMAANARIGAAMAQYYPHLSLTGVLNFVSLGASSLLTGSAVQASAGAGLRWQLFDFPRIDADVAKAKGKDAEALALYRSSILRATEEVENAFAGLGEGRIEVASLERQVAALRLARAQTQSAYESGAIPLLEVLDADRTLLQAADRLEQARAKESRASVAAMRALGGGYEEV